MIDIAEFQDTEGILQKDIAERQEIPLKYLDTIISGLKNSGLIINAGGKSSGYKLTRKHSEITVYDIYRAFEPELTLVNCLCDAMECKRSGTCPSKDYWFELNRHIKELMQTSNLEKVMNGEFRLKSITIQ